MCAPSNASGSPPREWGQPFGLASSVVAIGGSPPREWGQRPSDRVVATSVGFTPTRVGTAAKRRSVAADGYMAVHPHASGDSIASGGSVPTVHPHAWPPLYAGAAWVHPHASGDSVLTRRVHPHASGPIRQWTNLEKPVHPHASGDSSMLDGVREVVPISSDRVHPHASGDSAQALDEHIASGDSWCSPSPVHPHASGDSSTALHTATVFHRFTPTRVGTAIAPFSLFHLPGSPPREWGQPDEPAHGVPDDRFTPTRVGTAKRWEPLWASSRVHPHASGDSANHRPRIGTTVHPHASGDSSLTWQRSIGVHPHASGDSVPP